MASKQRSPRGLTPDGFRVMDFMVVHKINGNHRDYVLFVGDQMYDAWGRYTLTRPDGATHEMVALVHKRDLHKVIGEEPAKRFWDRRVGKRTSAGRPRHYAPRGVK